MKEKEKQKTLAALCVSILAYTGMGFVWAMRIALKLSWRGMQAVYRLARKMRKNDDAGQQLALKMINPRFAVAGQKMQPAVTPSQWTQLQQSEYVPADRIIPVKLDPPVGTIHLRVYFDKKVVESDLIVTAPQLRRILQERRFSLPEMPFDPKVGLDKTIDHLVKQAEETLNKRGQEMQAAAGVYKPTQTVSLSAARPAKEAKPAENQQAKSHTPRHEERAPAAKPVQKTTALPPDAGPEKKFKPQPTVGITFEGVLSAAGVEMQYPKGKEPYEIFEAKVRMDTGVEVPLRGAELERELMRSGVQLGERVAITPQGKVPVTLANGSEGSKNMYRVQRM